MQYAPHYALQLLQFNDIDQTLRFEILNKEHWLEMLQQLHLQNLDRNSASKSQINLPSALTNIILARSSNSTEYSVGILIRLRHISQGSKTSVIWFLLK